MSEAEKKGQETSTEEWNAIPTEKRGAGRDADAGGDVEAHGPCVRVRCWNCGAINLIDLDFDGFWCGRCGAWNSKW